MQRHISMKNILRIVLVLCSVCTQSFASYYDDYVGKIIPQSPQTAQLLKYGNYPVDHSSGLVQIDIPLYTIEYDGVTVPISISYHASGIKVDELASVVGLGWTLNAGGVIGRSIMGSEDIVYKNSVLRKNKTRFDYDSAKDVERNIYRLYSCDVKTNRGDFLADSICENLIGMCGNTIYDSQSDRYCYRFGNHSGSFRYDVSQDTIVLLPYAPIKCKLEKSKTFGDNGFTIKDENGVIYEFTVEDWSSSSYVKECPMEGCMHTGIDYPTTTTGWYLKQIITPNLKDTIRFEYYAERNSGTIVHPTELYHEGEWWSRTYEEDPYISGLYHINWIQNPFCHCFDNNLQYNYFSSPVVKKISWAGNCVEFQYDKDRPEDQSKLSNMLSLLRLKSLNVRNNIGEVMTNVEFGKGQFGHGDYNKRLLLSDLTIYSEDKKDSETYLFDYNTTIDLPDYLTLLGKNGIYCHCDYWGYYNGTNSSSFIPDWLLSRGGANREPVYECAKAGILRSITYPSGGTTRFEYEGNNTGECAGGLRIKEIANVSDNKVIRREVFNYSAPDYGSSIQRSELFVYNAVYVFQSVTLTNHCAGYPFGFSGLSTIDHRCAYPVCYTSEPCSPQSAFFGNCPFYTKVGKEVYDGQDNKVSYTEYQYEADHCLIPREDIPENCYIDLEPRFYSEEKNYDYGTVKPLLVSQKDYRYENGQRILERSLKNTYESVRSEIEPIVGVSVNLGYTTVVYDNPPVSHNWHPFETPAEFAANIFAFNVYGVPHYKRLVSTIEEESGVRTQTTYTYDSGFTTLRPLSVKTSRPGCSDVEKRYTYAFQSDDPVLKSMTRDNYVDLIVGERVLEGGVVSAKSGDIYKMENGRYLLAEKQYAVGNNPLETRLKMASHDTQGNVTEIVRDGDSHVFLVWGYNYQYPIMKIECPVGKDADFRKYLQNKAEAIGASVVPDENAVKEIRNYVENIGGLVSTYLYKPLVGLTEVIDEKGIRTFYRYDSHNRLSAIHDAEGKMIESYKYNYKKQEYE